MIIHSDFTQTLKLREVKADMFAGREKIDYLLGDYDTESSTPRFLVHNLPDISNRSNLITVKELKMGEGNGYEYKIVYQEELSSPAHLRKILKDFEVI